jgi:hypothetical protein
MRTHAKSKPFVCPYYGCGAAFVRKPALRNHSFVHSIGPKPFVCPFQHCDKSFVYKNSMQRHYFENHTKEGAKRRIKEENKMSKFLEAQGIAHDHQVHITFNCLDSTASRAYVDFVIYYPTHVVLLEIDEHQHDGYPASCDVRRMADVYGAVQTARPHPIPILWVRFNPHRYHVNGDETKKTYTERKHALLDLVMNYVPTLPQEIAYM